MKPKAFSIASSTDYCYYFSPLFIWKIIYFRSFLVALSLVNFFKLLAFPKKIYINFKRILYNKSIRSEEFY